NPSTQDCKVLNSEGSAFTFNLDTDQMQVNAVKAVQKNNGLLLGYYTVKLTDRELVVPFILNQNSMNVNFFSKLDQRAKTGVVNCFPFTNYLISLTRFPIMLKNLLFGLLLITVLAAISCNRNTSKTDDSRLQAIQDSIERMRQAEEAERNRPRTADDITLIKDLAFDKYILEDEYEYQDTFRVFQWDKIKERLAYIENFQREKNQYGIIVNYKNKNGEAPTVANFVRNDYKRVSDTLGTERYQSAPLYREGETSLPT